MIADKKTLGKSLVALIALVGLCYAVLLCCVAGPSTVGSLDSYELLLFSGLMGGSFYAAALFVLQRSTNREFGALRRRLQAIVGASTPPAKGGVLFGRDEYSALRRDAERLAQDLRTARKTLERVRQEFDFEVEKRTANLSKVSAELGEELAKSKRGQKEVQQSTELSARSFACSPVAQAVMTAREGCFLEANEQFLTFLNCSREDLLNHSDLELGLWDVPTARTHLLQQLADKPRVDGIECQIRTGRSGVQRCLLSAVRMEMLGAPCLVLSVRELKEPRSRDSEVFQKQKMEAVGQLAAGLAHDFNNILMIIQGHTSLLLGEPGTDERAQESLKHVSVATERAAHLTRQLLAFSRKQVMHAKTLDLNQLVEESTNVLSQLLGEKVSLRFKLFPRTPPVEADPAMLKEVIMDLAANARDALTRGGELAISTSSVALDSDYVRQHPDARIGQFACLTVADNGCGMDDATLRRIFEPFFTTKEVGKGTGLGLATVYGIVKQHNGWIEVASQPNQGTTFKIFLQASSKVVQPAPRSPLQAPELTGEGRILLVEDEPGLRALLQGILQRYGYAVIPAANGVEAIRAWEEQEGNIDLLLTDMVMPEVVSGHQLALMLRARDPELKVLFTSGYSPDLLGPSADEIIEGVNFLQKPYRPQKLAAAVRRCLTAAEEESDTVVA